MPEPLDFRRRRSGRQGAKPPTAHCPADGQPGWASGIRALYEGVAQEALPDEFAALLAELAKKSFK